MIINVHAGHNPVGKVGCGAVGILNESEENRKIKDLVIAKLQYLGHTVYDCTVDDGASQNDILTRIVKKCNAHQVDLDVSIHLNAGGGNGVEVLTWSERNNGVANETAFNVCSQISGLGFRNRGIKYRPDLYVLKKTVAPAILIECCFVDSEKDASIYSVDKMASAIVKGITGSAVTSSNIQKSASKSNEEIAKEVIQGKWGNGTARKKALENEGYDYSTIQSIVNNMLNG